MLWRWEEGGVWPASLTQFPHLQPSPTLAPDILTEDDVYCSCLAKTLCHVPVPVTVGFYAHFGCRLHMMLDKITGENLLVLGEERGRETSLWSLLSSSLPQDPLALRPACPCPDAQKSVLTRSLPTPTASAPHPCSFPH